MRRTRSVFIALTLGAAALGVGCSNSGGKSKRGAAGSGATTGTTSSTTTTTGSSTTPAPVPSRFLYTANYGDSSITGLTIDAYSGAPTPFGQFTTGDVPLRLVVGRGDQVLYSIERSEVTPFAIGATGALTPIGAPVVIPGDYPLGACMTPDGAFLLVGYYGGSVGGSVRAFAIGATGGLTEVSRFAMGATANPVEVVVDATSRFAYVVDGIAHAITVLQLVPGAGTLLPVGAPVACADVQAVALDATGTFLVAMTSASPGSIQSFAIGASGAITPRSARLGMGPHSPLAVSRGPDGRFYVVTANSSLIVATIDSQGTLTESSVTTIPAYGFPNAFAIDASNKFVYTANFAGDDVSVLLIDANGSVAAGLNVPVTPITPGNTTQPYFVVTVR